MCGIAGIIGREGEVVTAAQVQQMCRPIVHRGPDDEGLYVSGRVGLGMRRLSIIDLSGGHQPIHNEDETVWVVYNGEIYNFLELRRDLISRGHQFYTHSDTEVIVHLYEEMGAQFVTKLRGMFAIALYDEKTQRLLLARDRLGKKPLHYAVTDGRLLFGSEIKALLAIAPQLRHLNPDALLQFFYLGYIADPNTAFRQIDKLSPGHILEYVNRQVSIQRYWDIPVYGTYNPSSEEECLEALEAELAEAVRMRLISDVPLGALLSGGIDSSLVVALMARASSRPVKTFSIGFTEQDFNEATYARMVAERFGTDHHELIVNPNIEETTDSLTRMQEEPFADSSALPTFYICRLARQNVTVALSGDGGDELFAGYDRYRVHLNRQKFNHVPQWMGRYFRERLYPHLPSSLRGRRFAFNISLTPRDRYLDSISHLPARSRERGLFSDDFLDWTNDSPPPLGLLQEYFDRAPAPDPLSRLLYLDTKSYLTADVLCKVDRMSMANSLEIRCPILDHVVVEWAARLSRNWKLHIQSNKYILKKLAERVGVPRAVLHRPKHGFALPLAAWLREELKGKLLYLLLEPRTLQRGYFREKSLRNLISEHLQGRRDHSYSIWMLLVFELWHRNFLEVMPDAIGSIRCPAKAETEQAPVRQTGAVVSGTAG